MKVLFQKEYKDLLNQITSAETFANEKQREISEKNRELSSKSSEIVKIKKELIKKEKELTFTKEELLKMTKEKKAIDEISSAEIKKLKEKNREVNGRIGGYTARINRLQKELEEEKKKSLEKDNIIENFKNELKKHTQKKSVINYEKRIRR